MVDIRQSKMKIAIFSDVFLEVSGGITSSIMAQKDSLKALGHEVVIFCPGYLRHKSSSGHTIVDGRPDEDVILVPTAKLLSFGGAPRARRPKIVKRWIIENCPNFADFDLVHVHYEAACSIAGCQLARQFNIPLVQTMHGREDMAAEVNIPRVINTVVADALCFLHSRCLPHAIIVKKDSGEKINLSLKSGAKEAFYREKARRFRKKRLLAPTIARAKMWTLMVNHANFADVVITPTQHFADKLQSYGVTKPIKVVSNGVSDEIVAMFDNLAKRRKRSLARVLQPDTPLLIFWNSRVSREKRIMPLLKALTKISGEYKFTVCGDGNDLKRAKRFVRRHNMNVEFLGQVPHDRVIEQMLNQHLSATVSYGFDTQGLTLLEAEATGLPVFFCDPDMREVMPDGGAIMSKGPSPKQMARSLNYIMTHPHIINEMSLTLLSNRQKILQSTVTKDLLAAYKLALSQDSCSGSF